MRGFFSDSKLGNATAQGRTCVSCGLYKNVLSPVMPPAGSGKRGILNVGEAPGADEDKRGKPWQGKVGRVLAKTYRRLGIDLFDDCVNMNSVNCRPEKNRTPTGHEVSCCHNKLVGPTLADVKPHVIVLFGGSAVQSVIGLRWQSDLGGVMRWRGWVIPDRELGAWVCPVYHPSFVERESSAAVRTIWEQDLERAVYAANEPLPAHTDEEKYVTLLQGDDEIAGLLRSIESGSVIAFDYETTGLKPQAQGHRIVSASLALNEREAYAFVMPDAGPARSAFKKLLRDPGIYKMAHNMKFEDTWSAECLGVTPRGWAWDSMQAAHILDNRPNISRLKFQAYARLGVMDYSSHIEPYLQSKGDGGDNAFNTIDKLLDDPRGRRDLLMYNGLDSLYEYMIARQQQEELGYGSLSAVTAMQGAYS